MERELVTWPRTKNSSIPPEIACDFLTIFFRNSAEFSQWCYRNFYKDAALSAELLQNPFLGIFQKILLCPDSLKKHLSLISSLVLSRILQKIFQQFRQNYYRIHCFAFFKKFFVIWRASDAESNSHFRNSSRYSTRYCLGFFQTSLPKFLRKFAHLCFSHFSKIISAVPAELLYNSLLGIFQDILLCTPVEGSPVLGDIFFGDSFKKNHLFFRNFFSSRILSVCFIVSAGFRSEISTNKGMHNQFF